MLVGIMSRVFHYAQKKAKGFFGSDRWLWLVIGALWGLIRRQYATATTVCTSAVQVMKLPNVFAQQEAGDLPPQTLFLDFIPVFSA